MTTWEPQTYLRYADIRFRAGMDLMARVPKKAYRVIYDLGCGTGHLTKILADTFPEAMVTGVDSSPEMLAEARREFPELRWEQGDIRAWGAEAKPSAAEAESSGRDLRHGVKPCPDEETDLIYTNAALHWVGEHERLLPRLVGMLREGGVLAMQVPRHFESPSHLELKAMVLGSRWRARLEPLLLATIAPPESYWRWLGSHTRNLDIWETIYLQVLDGADPVVNFMKGTALRPFLSALPEAEGAEFLAEFAERMARAYPAEASGQTLFPFRRLFVVAQR